MLAAGILLLLFLFVTPTILLSSAQSAQNSSQKNKTTTGVNAPAPAAPIGNLQQLSKALGNNSQIIKGNINIDNPNASKAAKAQQKVTTGTPTSGLATTPTKGEPKNFVAGPPNST